MSTTSLASAARERVLVLDGAMGTMIQTFGLDEARFRGHRFANHPRPLKGCNDVLCLTAPEVIAEIHRAYLDAGADIIETNSFNSTPLSLAEYGLEEHSEEIAEAAARLARITADEWESAHPGMKRYVAGSMGPTGKSLTMGATLADAHPATWETLEDAFFCQAAALIRGGADLLLIETVFDGLNAKAALHGARRAMSSEGREVPLMVSVTLTESGRTLSGQTLEALWATIEFARPWAVGLNCGFGAEGLLPRLEALEDVPALLSAYPNAGLPDALGRYTESPEKMASMLAPKLESGMLNIVGGCCGTTPAHIAAIAHVARGCAPRKVPVPVAGLTLAGLEAVRVDAAHGFLNIGERCNVAGSRKFLRLIKEGAADEAVEIAASQVRGGASVIDINMDDAMLDSTACMSAFLTRIATEPDVARAPVMIDSSRWDTVTEALRRIQGKPVVNSISLKEGEEKFIERARHIAAMGAAMVVMLFDEKGQADTLSRRKEIAGRAYTLLTDAGINPQDIIFDPNVLALATGIPEHARYGIDFLDAVEWIKTNLPGARTSGGISNLSFSFRGNDRVRQAMHSVFLYHAIRRGLDMAIVNAAALPAYDDVDPALRQAIEDVIFNTRPDATERLTALASELLAQKQSGIPAETVSEGTLTPAQSVERMVMRGLTDGLEAPLTELHAQLGSAVSVIEGPLMEAMNRVGRLFGEGKMFLPQVVKSAGVMKRAVEILTPAIEAEKNGAEATSAGTMVIATVKGDVHDIGKNIVSVVMSCNGFRVVDLGVMVTAEEIIERAVEEKADFVGLSGLITPSLEEMCHVARMMEARGLTIPLMVGGATTSELHTAVKIAPCYSGPVVHTAEAASLPAAARRHTGRDTRREAFAELQRRQSALRAAHAEGSATPALTPAEARSLRIPLTYSPVTPAMPGRHRVTMTVAEVRPYINWRAFFAAWQMDASLAEAADHSTEPRAQEARKLRRMAEEELDRLAGMTIEAVVALMPATAEPDDIIACLTPDGEMLRIPVVRRPFPDASGHTLALSDYLAPTGPAGELPDWLGMFAVTTGAELARLSGSERSQGNELRALLIQTLADRLAEAATELLHLKVRQELWGYEDPATAPGNPGNRLRQYYRGIRPAVGYPSLPDQSLMHTLDRALTLSDIGLELTDTCGLNPAASTAGLIFAHPEARYFVPGPLPEAHQADYAERRSRL